MGKIHWELVFQSLIGTIKTNFEKFLQLLNDTQFQSLIGTIKTSIDQYLMKRIEEVSIPYRDDKNYIFFHLRSLWIFVSIPYRDDKNFIEMLLTVMPKSSFNPL